MSICAVTKEEKASWDDLIAKNPDGGSVFQSVEFAQIKQKAGWQPRFLKTEDSVYFLALERKVPLVGKVWYVPGGPGIVDYTDIASFSKDLKAYIASNFKNVFSAKIEPAVVKEAEDAPSLPGVEPTRPIQPNANTVIIDTSKPNDELLASFNQSARRYIRKGYKDGIEVRPVDCSDQNCQLAYDLYKSTSEGRFFIRSRDYHIGYWKLFADKQLGQMFFAYHEDKVVAAAYINFIGANALYKDGASVRQKVSQGASYVLQWEICRWLHDHGVKNYDLHGTPPAKSIGDKTHPKYGLGLFKTGFNKQITEYVGAYNIIIADRRGWLWNRYLERIFQALYFRIKKQAWY
ncbi:hypothetical protein CR956_01230 [Candidatus Saccharibacteria bacterium]|nr:MAG: hypothetical protein CR956_01230 [Candidatus Saccharibacteria bacterium]